MMRIISVEKIGEDEFTIVVGDDGNSYRSLCKRETVAVPGQQGIRMLHIESDKFQKLIMMGDLMVKDIAKAIELAS